MKQQCLVFVSDILMLNVSVEGAIKILDTIAGYVPFSEISQRDSDTLD